jgi:hypothetical protein
MVSSSLQVCPIVEQFMYSRPFNCSCLEFVAMGEYVPESLVPELTEAEELGITEETKLL